MIVGLDFDNVLANTTGSVLKYIHHKYDRRYYIEDIVQYDFAKIVGLKNKELWDCFLAVWTTHEQLEPMDYYAPYFINKMLESGHEVRVITAAGLNVVENWLKHWKYPDLPVIYTGNGNKTKAEYGLDVLVDDKLSHIEQFNNRGIIYNRPWNKQFFNTDFRVSNFRDLIFYITMFSELKK